VVNAEQNLFNKFRINKIVKNHFGLTEESKKLFRYRLLYEPHIAPEYAAILDEFGTKEDPLRARINIKDDIMLLASIDKGWKHFKDFFYCFITEYNVTYSNFRDNRVIINKQTVKLKKALVQYYSRNDAPMDGGGWNHRHNAECIQKHLEYIGTLKVSNKKFGLQLVLSLNFADWFLCSTGEKWSSCINLESDYEDTYWAGLPGLIGDKNRAILYVTDGKTKTYEGITVDRFLNRSWTLTFRQRAKNEQRKERGTSFINVVGEYPNNLNLTDMAIKSFKAGFVKNFENESPTKFVSKYYIENLFHKTLNHDSVTSYIYQDTTCNYIARKNKAEFSLGALSYLKPGSCGVNRYDRQGNHVDGQPVYYTRGLRHLISNNLVITNESNDNDRYYCYNCDCNIYEGEELYNEGIGEYYCSDCFDDLFIICPHCEESVSVEESCEVAVGRRNSYEYICNFCRDNECIVCNDCNETHYIDSTVEIENGKYVCNNCIENYFVCEECDTYQLNSERIELENSPKIICEDCFMGASSTKYFQCTTCNDYFEKDDDTIHLEESNNYYCSVSCREGEFKKVGQTELEFKEPAKAPITFTELAKQPIMNYQNFSNDFELEGCPCTFCVGVRREHEKLLAERDAMAANSN